MNAPRGAKFLYPAIGAAAASVAVSLFAQQGIGSTGTSTTLGKSIYDSRCAPCHGTNGKGDGPAALFLHPAPRDFSRGVFKFRTTASGSIPTDGDLERVIREGLHGSAMPDWRKFLRGDSLRAVIAYVKSFSPRFAVEKPTEIPIGSPGPLGPASIAAGKRVYEKMQCAKCHGAIGDGADAVTGALKDDWGYEDAATNLTEPWTYRGGSSLRDIVYRFRTGIDGTPMPSFAGAISEKESWDLACYVASLARKPIWEMTVPELRAFYTSEEASARRNPVERGKYLVASMGCADCHSGYTDDGRLLAQYKFAGGLVFDLYPFGKATSMNLTSDKTTGIGDWTDQQVKDAITKGVRPDGKRSLPFPMPWIAFSQLNDDDLNAIVAYLRTIPPIDNPVPEFERPNIFSYLWGKFRVLILHDEIPGFGYPARDFSKPLSATGQIGGSHAQRVHGKEESQ